MTADNQLEIKITQDLKSGEVAVSANSPTSFNVLLRLSLIALKGLKDSLIDRVNNSTKEDLIKLAFGEAFQKKMAEASGPVETIRADVIEKMEAEMYDMLNLSVSNFLDTEFPTVNKKPSLTELAAAEAGLDASATPEQLVEAEKEYIKKHPEEAAKTVDLQPSEIHKLNRAQRRSLDRNKKKA